MDVPESAALSTLYTDLSTSTSSMRTTAVPMRARVSVPVTASSWVKYTRRNVASPMSYLRPEAVVSTGAVGSVKALMMKS